MSWTELVGNAACLDFANSLDARPEPSRDWLSEPEGLRAWAVHAGLVPKGRADSTAGLLTAARDLRDAVYQVFSAVAAGRRAPQPAVAMLTSTAAEGLAVAHFRTTDGPGQGGSSYELVWTPADGDRQVLWTVADSALGLLRHGPLERVGECPSCGWLFLDTSRNGRRRWCSMAMCGNSVKSARHYARATGRG
jgi:predicted RNA-binding Zn ribbon-like protein